MDNKARTVEEFASLGGKARKVKLSPERRREIAQLAGSNKGKKNLPKATHEGILKIGEFSIECGVLPDKKRVISSVSIRNALGLSNPNAKKREKAKEANLPTFLASNALSPYFEEVFGKEPFLIEYVKKSGIKTQGVEATALVRICEIYLRARDDGTLSKPQLPIASAADLIMRSLAKVGIISLVDESSGYQEERAKDELQKLLEKYISEELRQWTKKFPNEFFKQIYRLHGWEYPNINKETMKNRNHPQYVGQFINKFIYERLPPGVKEELERKNPTNENGFRSHRHHQFLTENIGDDNLQKQITQIVTIMRISDNLDDFKKFVEKV